MTKTEIAMDASGKTIRRVIDEVEIDVKEELMTSLLKDAVLRCRNVLTVEGRTAHLALHEDIEWWTVPLDSIRLKTRFRIKDGVLVPRFADATESDPVFSIVWNKLESMKMVMLIGVTAGGINKMLDEAFLCVFDIQKRCWRLPLSNLYETCKICLGIDSISCGTSFEVLSRVIQQFNDSDWNSDLTNNPQQECAGKMFRFRPHDGGFEQLPVQAEDWTSICFSVSVEEMNYVTL